MFTGIIETLGQIKEIKKNNSSIDFVLSCKFIDELEINQSIAHNGVCLTVVEIRKNSYKVTAISESLNKSNLKNLQIGSLVNLERCIKVNQRFNGHIVQGHIDGIGIIQSIKNKNKSYWLITVLHKINQFITVEKGSITLNGISLTIINSNLNSFSVAIIPYTWEHTNINSLKIDDEVNLEFDIIGKYIQKLYYI